MLALHAGSRGFDSHRGHMSKRFFRSYRSGYPHPVSSELENSGIRVAGGDSSVTERGGGVRLIKPAKLCICTQNTTNTTRTDAHAGCVRQWFRTAEPLGERRYDNWNTHTRFWQSQSWKRQKNLTVSLRMCSTKVNTSKSFFLIARHLLWKTFIFQLKE